LWKITLIYSVHLKQNSVIMRLTKIKISKFCFKIGLFYGSKKANFTFLTDLVYKFPLMKRLYNNSNGISSSLNNFTIRSFYLLINIIRYRLKKMISYHPFKRRWKKMRGNFSFYFNLWLIGFWNWLDNHRKTYAVIHLRDQGMTSILTRN
jgi:hypothetical protein